MTSNTLIDQGVSLMLYGMGTVFVFLTVLVFSTSLMSKVINRFNDTQSSPAKNPEVDDQPPTDSNLPSPQIISAIEKAIALHRTKK